jgi:uncharacterized protein
MTTATQTIAITGATGLVGQALTALLTSQGHTVVPIVRRLNATTNPPGALVWAWDQPNTPAPQGLSGIDALVHLAGESITGRWTNAKKQAILASRVAGTQHLVAGVLSLPQPPKTVFSASAIGYYGNRGDTLLTETDGPGSMFLSQVAIGWEAATQPLSEAGIRVVNGRFGIVLSTKGGALAAMMPIFQLGGGGIIGNGLQYWSWIALPDLARAIAFCVESPGMSGPVNCVAPWPMTNQQFTKAVGHAIGRPTIVPLPAFAARLVMGEMADELLLGSTRVEPKQLLTARFHFNHTELEPTLRQLVAGKL